MRNAIIVSVLLRAAPLFGDVIPAPLHNGRVVIEGIYDSLAPLEKAQRVRVYNAQPAATKADLWVTHLERLLATRPDLSTAERSVLLEGIGLVASGAVDFDRPFSEQSDGTRESLLALEIRARATLRPGLVASVFAELGPPQRNAARGRKWRARVNEEEPICTCAVDSSYTCGGPTDPEPYCRRPIIGGCTVTMGGCGFLFLYVCDGKCYSTPPPPPQP